MGYPAANGWTKGQADGDTPSLQEIVSGVLHLKIYAKTGGGSPYIGYWRTAAFDNVIGSTTIMQFRYLLTAEPDTSAGWLQMENGVGSVQLVANKQDEMRLTANSVTYYAVAATGTINARITMKAGVSKLYLNNVLVATAGFALSANNKAYFGIAQGANKEADMWIDYMAYDETGAYSPTDKSDEAILGIKSGFKHWMM